MRNIIQKQKIDMANEVIDAGRFDMQTTNEERRKTLEEMLLVSWQLFFIAWTVNVLFIRSWLVKP